MVFPVALAGQLPPWFSARRTSRHRLTSNRDREGISGWKGSGANGILEQDKVLPEAALNASFPKHDRSGSDSSRCSAVFCLDRAVDRQVDRAEDRP